jgi:hypothetical protein
MRIGFSCAVLLTLGMMLPGAAQTSGGAGSASSVLVPRLIRFGGTLATDSGGAATHARVTFALYRDQIGGSPLWTETQDVQEDNAGRYAVSLGSSRAEGLPLELFTSLQARWLGVRREGEKEQPRILLLTVPYALKAADTETLGGKPPSAYAAAAPSGDGNSAAGPGGTDLNGRAPLAQISGSGTTNFVPLWTSVSNLSSSPFTQSATGTVGFGGTLADIQFVIPGGSTALAGVTSQPNGTGVSGSTTANQGSLYGVLGLSQGPTGIGVVGKNTASTGAAVGTLGVNNGDGGFFGPSIGVGAMASAASGTTSGVAGVSASPDGFGGSFKNTVTGARHAGRSALNPRHSDEGNVQDVGVQAEGGNYTNGFGTVGVGIALSATSYLGFPAGIWGTTNSDGGIGLVGTADDAIAVRGFNNSTDPHVPAGYFDNVQNRSEIAPIILVRSRPFDGLCEFDVSGDLTCSGSISAVVPVESGLRSVAMYAEDSPENWFEDAGTGRLEHGAATVALEPIFAQTVNSAVQYHVFVTPTGECNGLYIGNKTASGFEVHELGGGTSSVGFDYRIVVRRKGFEEVRLADKTEQFSAHVATRAKHTSTGSSNR